MRANTCFMCMQEETQEYADETKLKELVGKYSEFINFPIYLWSSKEVEKEVPADEDDAETNADADADSAEDVADEDEVSDEAEGKLRRLPCLLSLLACWTAWDQSKCVVPATVKGSRVGKHIAASLVSCMPCMCVCPCIRVSEQVLQSHS